MFEPLCGQNDMPIVWPADLRGLCLVPFQINTHYIDEVSAATRHTPHATRGSSSSHTQCTRTPLATARDVHCVSL